MDKMWKQVVLGLVLGLMLPRMILNMVGSETVSSQETPETSRQQTQPATTEGTQGAAVIEIPVLRSDGTVEQMALEEYVRGVVLAEMSASFETEALKAQAVVARTYTLRRLQQGDKHSAGAVCTDSECCQAYITDGDYLLTRGARSDWDKVAQAVADTQGQVLTYQGKLIEATYFACSGGRTEDAAAVWGADIPYLQAVDSPGEEENRKYSEELYFTAAQFSAALGRDLSGSPEQWFGNVTLTNGGGVNTMVIGGITYTGLELRKLLDLNSTVFTVTADELGVAIQTLGWGHRVGMSQYGADAMAAVGSTYDEILLYYYQGTVIDKTGNLG